MTPTWGQRGHYDTVSKAGIQFSTHHPIDSGFRRSDEWGPFLKILEKYFVHSAVKKHQDSFPGAVLRGALLRGALLRGALFREAGFFGAAFFGAALSGSDLPEDSFLGASLPGAAFFRAAGRLFLR
ncbi:MAG: hypothetical protein GY697_05720 [Desulfobacterales bacterium]|nr:hypothetical protein [Desulfobacterales bacterium]